MKLPNNCEKITVEYLNGGIDNFTPCSKIDEFEDCYEFLEKYGEGEEERTYMNVIMRNAVKKVTFIYK